LSGQPAIQRVGRWEQKGSRNDDCEPRSGIEELEVTEAKDIVIRKPLVNVQDCRGPVAHFMGDAFQGMDSSTAEMLQY
jgi:hypothetical protein